MGVEFEWDAKKARSNKATHRVDFQEALTVFADPLARIFEDEEHSEEEAREIIIGRIRIISARKATPAERKDYEENVGS